MKKPHFDTKKKPYTNNNRFKGKPIIDYTNDFDVEKLKSQSGDVVELFKLIQAVRYDRTNYQEEYNEARFKLNNDRMELESELIRLKKQYNAKISSLQEEYNSVKSNSIVELAKLRKS
jgi:hypothetical protein